LRHADLVACGTELVAAEVRRLGTAPERILVTPTGVDVDAFAAPADGAALRARLGIADRFVVGWVGSFRRMHALDTLIDAVAGVERAVLLVVGDGPERPRIEALARERGVHAVFTGTVAHAELPDHLAAMDVAAVVAGTDHEFHYSPLKLAEYLAAGRPVIAPAVPQLTTRLRHGDDVVFVGPGDVPALRDAIVSLRDDDALRMRLAANARATARADWSWDQQITMIDVALAPRAAGGR
jgi:glycosyltransferase involved in cell wall biosynthesis